MGIEWLSFDPHGKRPRYPMNRRLGGLQRRSGLYLDAFISWKGPTLPLRSGHTERGLPQRTAVSVRYGQGAATQNADCRSGEWSSVKSVSDLVTPDRERPRRGPV